MKLIRPIRACPNFIQVYVYVYVWVCVWGGEAEGEAEGETAWGPTVVVKTVISNKETNASIYGSERIPLILIVGKRLFFSHKETVSCPATTVYTHRHTPKVGQKKTVNQLRSYIKVLHGLKRLIKVFSPTAAAKIICTKIIVRVISQKKLKIFGSVIKKYMKKKTQIFISLVIK